MIDTNKKDIILGYILYIYLLVNIQKRNNNVKVLINFDNMVNKMTFVYPLKLVI